MNKIITCIPRVLTPAQSEIALRRSIEINPSNALTTRTVARASGRRGGPRRLALLVGSRWPVTGIELSVQFLDNASNELRSMILKHMNAWSKTANIRFSETNETGMVRIARLDYPKKVAGYWSYVGTQILAIEDDKPTMNLQGFTARTPQSEFRRVVRHEAGHTLGFEHEHMRSDLIKKIDRKKAFAYYELNEDWQKEETIEQVLTPLSKTSIMGTTESDPLSIMCYEIPAEITKDGVAIVGGDDISENDFRFAGEVYPLPKNQAVGSEEFDTQLTDSVAPLSDGIVPADNDAFQIIILDSFEPSSGKNITKPGAKKLKPKFVQVLASFGGARVTSSMQVRSEAGDTKTHFGKIISIHQRIKEYTSREQGSLPQDEELIEFGSCLFDTLFQGDVRRLYDEARARSRSQKLDIVLTSMIPWIAEKPWEFSYDPIRESFLATEDVHLIRNVLTAIPASVIPPKTGPLKILVVVAQPIGLGLLSVSQEIALIRRGFKSLEKAGLVSIEVMARATPGQVHDRISAGQFTVVHFIGHGTFDEDKDEGALIFEDEQGKQIHLGQRSVREIFCQRGVSLIFLNACQTGAGGFADFNKGVAQALVSHGLPALVANQYSVLDSSATTFAQRFYWGLAQGMSIGKAACEARIAVNYSMSKNDGELIDWAIPVVYARDPKMSLCAPDKQAKRMAFTNKLTTEVEEETKREIKVAIWDIDNSFPGLETTLRKLNDAQPLFGFELVSLSAPLDAWYMDQKASDGRPYLWAEKLAERLGRVVAELKVNLLICITRHWMCDYDTLNLYGWWPDEKEYPIIIFSCAGLEVLELQGEATDRAIANNIATGLTGYFAETGTHTRGSKNCPMSFNAERDLSVISGKQEFDKQCLSLLKKKIPRELPSIEAILNVFN